MKCNKAVVFPAILLFAITVSGQILKAPKPVEPADEPLHSLILENEYVRVFRLEIPRFKQTELHNHSKDFVRVSIGEGTASFARAGFTPMSREFDDGYTQFISGGFGEVVKNEDPTITFRALEIEIKQGLVRPGYVYGYSNAVAQYYDTFPLPTDRAASYRVTHEAHDLFGTQEQLLPGDATSENVHQGPRLLIAVTDLELQDERAEKMIEISRGDVLWFAVTGLQSLRNKGKDAARFITLEFK